MDFQFTDGFLLCIQKQRLLSEVKTLKPGHLVTFKAGTLSLELPLILLCSILAKGFSEIQQKGFYIRPLWS